MIKLENMRDKVVLASAQAISNDYVCDDYKALEKEVKSIVAIDEDALQLKEYYLEQFKRLHEFQENKDLSNIERTELCLDILEKAVALVKVLKGEDHRYFESVCMEVQEGVISSTYRPEDFDRFERVLEDVERLGLAEGYNVPLTRVGFEDVLSRLETNVKNCKVDRDKAMEIWEELNSCNSFIKFTDEDKKRLNDLLGLINVTRL